MNFDNLPLVVIFLLTASLIMLSIETGYRLGRRRCRQISQKPDSATGAMVGATMGLLAFMLGFTFNGAAERHDLRRNLVVEETNAIGTSYRRAGYLSEPYRTQIRRLLQEYVDIRVQAVQGGNAAFEPGLTRTNALQDKLWSQAMEIGQKEPGSIMAGLFIQSLNEVIDLHLKRLTTGIRHRVLPSIWVSLYLLVSLAMAMMGFQVGLNGSRMIYVELAMVFSFSVVLFLIADLDRPQLGLIQVSQQAMIELQNELNGFGR